ncbi:MAG: hypothetical protein RIQ79_2207 [Verrucomicrobiota bacterium]
MTVAGASCSRFQGAGSSLYFGGVKPQENAYGASSYAEGTHSREIRLSRNFSPSFRKNFTSSPNVRARRGSPLASLLFFMIPPPTSLENLFNRINDCRAAWCGFSLLRPLKSAPWPLRTTVGVSVIFAPLTAVATYLFCRFAYDVSEVVGWCGAGLGVLAFVALQALSARFWNLRASRLRAEGKIEPPRRSGLWAKISFALVGILLVGLPLLWCYFNVGGSHEWAQVKAATEAKGQSLSYESLVLRRVPDEQNALAAPGMAEVFISDKFQDPWGDTTELQAAAKARSAETPKVGTVTFVIDAAAPVGEPRAALAAALAKAVAASWPSSEKVDTLKLNLSSQNAAPFPRLDVSVSLPAAPAPGAFGKAFPASATLPFVFELRDTTAEGVFDLHLRSCPLVFADEFFAWAKRFDPLLEQVRSAATRPYAYVKGDYSEPLNAPIPKFKPIRTLDRLIEQQALTHLRRGDADSALRDLETMAALRRMIGSPGFTLVASMIDAVVAEHALKIVAEGFARGAWKQDQLAALEALLRSSPPVLPRIHRSLQLERSWVVWLGDENNPFLFGKNTNALAQAVGHALAQGWIDHSRASYVGLMNNLIESIDPELLVIDSVKNKAAQQSIESVLKKADWRDSLVLMAMPAFGKVIRTAARTQTQARLALLACAAERHRLDTGAFPEKLDGLVPKYLPKLPLQVVNGQPFLCRREADGSLLIWSIGWDLKDDSANTGPSAKLDDKSPDWAWRLAP